MCGVETFKQKRFTDINLLIYGLMTYEASSRCQISALFCEIQVERFT